MAEPKPPQGLAFWPDVETVIACQYSRNHGITPGIASLEMLRQDGPIQEVGILRFTFGNGFNLPMRDCKADFANKRLTAPNIWTVSILDRRLWWRYQYVGETKTWYNRRMGDNTIDPATQQTAKALADILLAAMGETEINTSALPTDIYPELTLDYSNPSQELAALAESLGFRFIYRLDESILIQRAGTGSQSLPIDDDVTEDTRTTNPPEVPETVRVVASFTEVQVEVTLDAVGLDLDGAVDPIDSVSYKPAGGWGKIPWQCEWVEVAEGRARELAAQSCFLWYRIPDTFDVPLWKDGVTRQEALLSGIKAELVESVTEDGKEKRRPAQVRGSWSNFHLVTQPADTPLSDHGIDFTLDTETGICAFRQPMWKIDGGASVPADLKLRFTVLVPRYYLDFSPENVSKTGTTAIVRADDVVLLYNGSPVDGGAAAYVNKTEVDEYLNLLGTSELAKYVRTEPRQVTYRILRDDIDLNGKIESIGINVGKGAATMTASEGDEYAVKTPGYNERRMYEKINRELLGREV